MSDLDRAVRSWEEWDRGIRSGDPRSLEALGRLLAGMARKAERGVTPREIEVLQALAEGATAREAGVLLGIGEQTVKSHLKNLTAQLGARNKTHAVAIGMERRLIR